MERNARSRLNTQIYEEACEWFVEARDRDLDERSRRELDRWLRQSPEHLRAYLEVAAIWNEGPALDPQGKWSADTLIAQAAQDGGNVVALASQPVAEPPARSSRPAPRGRPFAVAASVAAIGLALLATMSLQLFRVPTYTTAIGEQRSFVLDDGSTVVLNSRSRIKVRYSEAERAVDLQEGQALFLVSKDHARPFIVTSGDTQVRAVGTQFDVYKRRDGTVVTVLEGRVAILTEKEVHDLHRAAIDAGPAPTISGSSERTGNASQSGAGVFLSGGEQLTVTDTAIRRIVNPNIASATAWTRRQLLFDSASLADVAEEFNRYNQRQLIIEDPELYGFHINGVFSSSNPTSLIRFLREQLGVSVTETASEIRVSKEDAQAVTGS